MKPTLQIRNAVIVNGRLFGQLLEDHPERPHLQAYDDIISSTVISGSVEQGMVETRNTIYVIQGDNNETA